MKLKSIANNLYISTGLSSFTFNHLFVEFILQMKVNNQRQNIKKPPKIFFILGGFFKFIAECILQMLPLLRTMPTPDCRIIRLWLCCDLPSVARTDVRHFRGRVRFPFVIDV